MTAKEFKLEKKKKDPAAQNADSFSQSKWRDMQSAKYSQFIIWLEAQKPNNSFDQTAMLARSVRARLEQDRTCPICFDWQQIIWRRERHWKHVQIRLVTTFLPNSQTMTISRRRYVPSFHFAHADTQDANAVKRRKTAVCRFGGWSLFMECTTSSSRHCLSIYLLRGGSTYHGTGCYHVYRH